MDFDFSPTMRSRSIIRRPIFFGMVCLLLLSIAACGAAQDFRTSATSLPAAVQSTAPLPPPSGQLRQSSGTTTTPETSPQFVMPTPIEGKPAPPDDWTYRWLQGIPCVAPCWEGITVGQTS